MPLYEYACQECGRRSELLIHADAQPHCPECGGARMTKLLSVVAAPLRGQSSSGQPEMPSGPCGSACGCFPQG